MMGPLSLPALAQAQAEQSAKSLGLLDPDAKFSGQSVTLDQFRSLLKQSDAELSQVQTRIEAMRPDALDVNYQEGKAIDEGRANCLLSIKGSRKLIAFVLERGTPRIEVQLVLSLNENERCLEEFGSDLSNMRTAHQTEDMQKGLDWADELLEFRKQFVLRRPRILVYVLAHVEQLNSHA